MGYQTTKTVPYRQKRLVILMLYLGSSIIMFLGFFFTAFSFLKGISFQVLNATVPGFVFGLLVAYLGLRYYLQVSDFKTDFYQNSATFSWSNFVKDKKTSKNKGIMKGR